MGEFGDFQEIKDEAPQKKEVRSQEHEQEKFTRARMPRQGQIIGVVLQRLGGNRMSIKSTDNKIRNCRVPGRFSRKFWLRTGNYVIIEPWPDNDDKGDIVYQYHSSEINQLKRKYLVNNLETEF